MTRMSRYVLGGDWYGEPVPPLAQRTGIQRRTHPDPLSDKQRTVLAALHAQDEPVGAAELAEELDMSTGEVRRALGNLRELRLVSAERRRGPERGNVWSAV